MSELFWITGLAGAGKTTIAKGLVKTLREGNVPVVLLDGDELRQVLSMTDQHDCDTRLKLANVYARLSALFCSQGVTTVCATISPFPEVRHWLRENVTGYREVFVRASDTTLIERDQKGLYRGDASLDTQHIVGKKIPFAPPTSPDVIIDNEPGTIISDHVRSILRVSQHSRENLRNVVSTIDSRVLAERY
jgi:cytidine diphosphoramidate kinase